MFRVVAVLVLAVAASAEVVHPCANNPTRECFANHMATVAGCIPPTSLPAVDSFTGLPSKVELPYFRATLQRTDTTIVGVSNVEAFVLFFDTVANLTVLSYNFPSVTINGTQEVQIHSPGEIDTVITTSFRTTYTNVNVTVQWFGYEKVLIGQGGKLYTKIDSESYNFEADYPELAAAVQADPQGKAAEFYQAITANPKIYVREQETPAGVQIVRPFFNNWLCTNLP